MSSRNSLRTMSIKVNPRAELERAEALARSHDDEAALTAARRVRKIAEASNDFALMEDVQLAIERFEVRAKEWRDGVMRRYQQHVDIETKSAA